jgi:hypothetical protein
VLRAQSSASSDHAEFGDAHYGLGFQCNSYRGDRLVLHGGGWTANSNGPPWREWTGTEVPLPGHPYLIAAELPASRGGGPKGSVVFVSRAAVNSDGAGARGPHALNLETRRWSRLTSAEHPQVAGIYSSVIFDDSSAESAIGTI